MTIETQLKQGAKQIGIELEEIQVAKLLQYLELIIKWNKTYNLSAIRTPEQGVEQHLLDSLSIISYIGRGDLLDIGSGAGLPGIVIAIMKPNLSVSVLDTVGKKCRFMQYVKTQLKLKNLTVVNQRVESYQPAQCFSQITSRAFAEVKKTLDLSAHLLCDNGKYLLMKGANITQENLSKNTRQHVLNVPSSLGRRFLIEIMKK
ncbi:rRNA small subunit 7-methylguanosine (m7G) methyltransferase GidB [Bathymodiolus heckerae thiotrophic gill symbiont]|uniref:16S rRNA (guanine(527)-N(7))-methyltransferase RsmG n=1 Tax=Bathymodiolus heckerae thiotrophic gill symbiont TaxID=1052212 RepID=UPI0010B2DB9B|nr:16S rRNA (guanine(527)-N(7))-methyltransferase RsmG [Bathymodiolus heckerae thiotrophic gill symbiont]SHN91067.1 rRNA small subunit 7-methylguanosine (m7G) methyltransferase GidB [Bathymodiolus heckerae thiotrophic gill symbiont]